MRLLALPAVLCAVMIAGVAGCGGTTAEKGAGANALRQDVYEFRTDSTVSLASRTPDDRPTLLWFWAPWCEICNAEASTVEKMANASGSELRVIAIGGRDSVKAGREFVERHRLKAMTVVYDEPSKVWDGFGIGPQPAAVLLDAGGNELRRWQGPFEPSEVEAAVRTDGA